MDQDPKILWKSIPSNQDEPFSKPDDMIGAGAVLGKKLIAASHRGRSHASMGYHREDDFSMYTDIAHHWAVLSVSDGAGAYEYSRLGSSVAAQSVVSYCKETRFVNGLIQLDEAIEDYFRFRSEAAKQRIDAFIEIHLEACAKFVHHSLISKGGELKIALDKMHATLSFVLLKKYKFGYALFSFGVGDSPIALVRDGGKDVKLLNKIDVGDSGIGTEFISMHEIFDSVGFNSRFSFQIVPNFDFLFLMTDGISAPKLGSGKSIADPAQWRKLIADLNGKNDGKFVVDWKAQPQTAAQQLLQWLGFWDLMNHDDRTMIVVY